MNFLLTPINSYSRAVLPPKRGVVHVMTSPKFSKFRVDSILLERLYFRDFVFEVQDYSCFKISSTNDTNCH